MTDLQTLVSQCLSEREKQRARQKAPFIYAFCGERQPGEIAPEFGKCLRVLRKGDTLPADCLHWSESRYGLQNWYEQVTYKTGPNVRRWVNVRVL